VNETSASSIKNKKLKRIFWLLLFLAVVCFTLTFVGIRFFANLPSFTELDNPKLYEASELISDDGYILGKYYTENRSIAEFDELPTYLVDALVSTEDERFYNHCGIDYKGTARAFIYLGKKGGGSTISQQLALNLFDQRATNRLDRMKQKLKEIVTAVLLERRYTKEEIIAMYLNKIEYRYNSFGVKSVAKLYFSIPEDSIQNLNIQEAATLVGMVQNPSRFNPLRREELTTKRRNVVLYQMVKNDKLTRAQFDSISKLPLGIKYSPTTHNTGLAPYFREVLRADLKKWADENDYDVYRDGLKIYTTINSKMQRYAELAVNEHLKEHQKDFFYHWDKQLPNTEPWEWGDKDRARPDLIKRAVKRLEIYKKLAEQNLSEEEILKKLSENKHEMRVFSWAHDNYEVDTAFSTMDSLKYYKKILHAGLLSVDPSTGYVKAWVGGINHKYFKLDHVKQSTKRQVGSTFKPIVYSLAIEDKGWSPCMKLPKAQITFHGAIRDWTPRNSPPKYEGYATLKGGLAGSINTIAARIMYEFNGPLAVINQAKKLGIVSDIPEVPSICLGTADISVFEMVGAFSTFANKGLHIKPNFIDRIEDRHGNIVYESEPQQREALNENTAYVMTNMLQGVTSFPGTASRLRHKYKFPASQPIAGKTGTTQGNTDGWFMGYTPQLLTGVWVGADDPSVRFRKTFYGQGAAMALPIWAKYYHKVYDDESLGYSRTTKFEKPKNELTIELDCEEYYEDNPEGIDYGDEGYQYGDEFNGGGGNSSPPANPGTSQIRREDGEADPGF